tara:strand:+ start:426 stop:992 length:567 start_codon:yes stop_codon:yes gene_type:complete
MLVNSHSTSDVVNLMYRADQEFSWVKLVHSNIKKSLKDAIWTGWNERDRSFIPDVVQIIETDAVPNMRCLNAMLRVYQEELSNQIGSVTPMYKWQGKFCYPTHNHWHRDPSYKRHPKLGHINNVGGCGVPFLYSLWRPNLMEYINRPSFKHLIHLDRDFGNHLHKMGYKHLRLTEHSVDHYGGGRKSR